MIMLLFQVNEDRGDKYIFRGYTGSIDSSVYDLAYLQSRDAIDLTDRDAVLAELENIYYELNEDRPEDYRTRSLSVSDIVTLSDGKTKVAAFCDTVGWEFVTDQFNPVEADNSFFLRGAESKGGCDD